VDQPGCSAPGRCRWAPGLPTLPPRWGSDFRGCLPLDTRSWVGDNLLERWARSPQAYLPVAVGPCVRGQVRRLAAGHAAVIRDDLCAARSPFLVATCASLGPPGRVR
jgi:hypothetical protein